MIMTKYLYFVEKKGRVLLDNIRNQTFERIYSPALFCVYELGFI